MLSALLWAQTFAAGPNPPTDATRKANDAVAQYLPFSNTQDFDDARHGFIADLPSPLIKGASGNTVIDLSAYDFLKKSRALPPNRLIPAYGANRNCSPFGACSKW